MTAAWAIPSGASTSTFTPITGLSGPPASWMTTGRASSSAQFWIKINRECDDIANLTLGGLKENGEDATNPLTLLCLQVERWVSRKQPNLSVRVHQGTPPALWDEIAASILRGAGHPGIFNDDVIIPGLMDYGFTAGEARTYAPVGCVETYLPGVSAPWTDAYLNLAKCVELALNDGRDQLSGAQIGPKTGDPHSFNEL